MNMRVSRWLALVTTATVWGGCGSAPTLQSTVRDSLGDPIDVTAIKNLCDLPVGTPLTEGTVLLGCADGKIPILLDTRCQATAPTSRSCAYAVDAFVNPPKPNPADTRMLTP
jgi:hypothetical protein